MAEQILSVVDDGEEGLAPKGTMALRDWRRRFEAARASNSISAVQEQYLLRRTEGLTGPETVLRERTRFLNARTKEVMTTSDFLFMADLIDRGVLSGYTSPQFPTNFQAIARRRDTVDLARANSEGRGRDYTISAPRLVPKVAEKGEYLPIDPFDTYFEFKTYKYGCQWDVSWEAWLHDNRDLKLISEYPGSMGLSARYTQQYLFTAHYAESATLFANSHNYPVGHPQAGTAIPSSDNLLGLSLTAANLGTAITTLRKFTDLSGNTFPYTGTVYLVVPPDLEYTARQILQSTVFITGENSTQGAANPYQGAATLIVDPFLTATATSWPTTGWYLFADPAVRPALRYGYLQGYDQPEVFVKAADAQRLVGGASDPMDGNFASDDIEFKLRFTYGVDDVYWQGCIFSHP